MSLDAKISHLCPHYIRYERTDVIEGIEVPTRTKINGTGLLILRKDGVSIPPSGLFSLATIYIPKKEPYRFKDGSHILVIDGHSITLNTKKTYTSKDLISQINSVSKDFRASLYSGSVKITHYLKDRFEISGSALSSLGFSKDKAYGKSKRLTPSWTLSKSLNGLVIRFDKVLDPVGILDISYTTAKETCTRCESTGIENDFRFDSKGEIELIQDHDLLYQSVAKILLTEKGSNPFHLWYGSDAFKMIGKKSNSATAQALKQSVRDALDRLVATQGVQATVQNVSLKERISSVRNVDVRPIGDDPTSVLCTVTVISASSETVSVNIIFQVPNSIDLSEGL